MLRCVRLTYLNFDTRIAQLATITRDDIHEFYDAKFSSHNARFYIVGDMPDGGAAVAARMEKIFSKLPRGTRLKPIEEPALGLFSPVITQRDIQTVYYEVLALGEGMERSHRTPLTALRLLLIGGAQSRIYGRARREGLAYHLSVSAGASRYDSDMSFDGYVSPDKLIQLFSIYQDELARLMAGDLTDRELDGPKNLGIGSTERSMQTPADILSWYVGPYDMEEYIRDYDTYLEQLRAVSAQEVLDRLKEVLARGARATSLLGNLSDEQSKEFSLAAAKIWSNA
jgi:predicted Zn-dependent peptidase